MNAPPRRTLAHFVAIISMLVLVVGCVPIQRIEWKTSQDDIRISPDNDKSALSVSVRTGTDDPERQPVIDSDLSFATNPCGNRMRLKVQANKYATDAAKTNPTVWILDDVYLVNLSRRKGVQWTNGNWKLDLFFQDPVVRPPIHSEFRLYTYWYCPLFTRPF